MLRSALVDAGSPYSRLVEAVSMTLPEIDAATADRVRALVAAGPPVETVGVTDTLPFPSAPVAPIGAAAGIIANPADPVHSVPPAAPARSNSQEPRS